MKTGKTGDFGENKAIIYLQKERYQIIERNFRKKWGEIDIVAKDKKTKEIVFIEVKTRQLNYNNGLSPEEALTSKKVHRLKKVFLSYLNQYNLENKPWRFDFIAIEIDNFSQEPRLPCFARRSGQAEIRHYKNIFLEF